MNNNRNNMGRGCSNHNGTAGGCRRNNGACGSVLNKLRAVDFALTETVLYLDAYPTCEEAKNFYRKLVTERQQLIATYESQCGPLTMYGNTGATWEWTEGPWPWEADAN